ISASEDHTIKLWETESYTQQQTLQNQSDWAVALAVAADNSRLFIGRLDGSLTQIPLKTSTAGGIAATPIQQEPLNPPASPGHAVAQTRETEPNNTPGQAVSLPIPG